MVQIFFWGDAKRPEIVCGDGGTTLNRLKAIGLYTWVNHIGCEFHLKKAVKGWGGGGRERLHESGNGVGMGQNC